MSLPFQGRAKRWEVKESDYDKAAGAMGRMPITIKLGDFFQKRPTAALSLLEDMDTVDKSVPPENDMARKLFLATPLLACRPSGCESQCPYRTRNRCHGGYPWTNIALLCLDPGAHESSPSQLPPSVPQQGC